MDNNDKKGSYSVINDPRRELVKRVIASSTFARSKRLSSFLLYICDQAIKGQVEEINEQKIGEVVFERPPGYDASADGIVRTQASRLRRRLEKYYQAEGVDERIRIVVPRGGYVPTFEPLPSESSSSSTPPPPMPPSSHGEPWTARAWLLQKGFLVSSLVAIFLITAIIYFFFHSDTSGSIAAADAVVDRFWSQIFVKQQATSVIAGDTGLVIWQWLRKRRIDLREFLSGSYREMPKTADDIERTAVGLSRRRYTTIVDLRAVLFLSNIATVYGEKLDVRQPRDVQINELKERNIILLGAPEANPWVELFVPKMKFIFVNAKDRYTFYIENRAPRSNEPQRWSSDRQTTYGIVAYLPGLDQNKNVLIIAGLSMTGTESALEFLSDKSQLSPFLRRVQRSGGEIPHFQVVVKSTHMTQTPVQSGTVIAWRLVD